MKKKDIQKKYLEKLKILNNYNLSYYEKSQPEVDDQKYDKLKIEILNLESQYDFLKSTNSLQ